MSEEDPQMARVYEITTWAIIIVGLAVIGAAYFIR